MAGCFFLGETTIERKKEERLFFHNEEISGFNKGLELWPQFVNKESFSIDGFLDDSNRSSFGVMRQQGGGMNCQDCGNQAKKDCPYLRCRTCCKSRGFRCQTHVKSTWVPAAERRQRFQQNTAMAQQQQQHHEPPAFRVDQSLRRQREDRVGPSLTNYLPTEDTTQGFEGRQFPTEINSPADFQCVRLSPSMDEGDEEYGYQTAVNIGGRVYRGILYDQGLDVNPYGESSSHAGFGSQPAHLNVLDASTATASTTSNPPSSAQLLDPSLYPPPLHTFMDHTPFFPPTTKP